jgi:hypothetical protein
MAELKLDTKTLQVNLEKLDRRTILGIAAAMDYQATKTEFFMKTNAKWTDRTGHARSSLFTATKKQGNSFYMLLSHTASYGIWLEVRFSGRYAIIVPGLRFTVAGLPKLLNKLLEK